MIHSILELSGANGEDRPVLSMVFEDFCTLDLVLREGSSKIKSYFDMGFNVFSRDGITTVTPILSELSTKHPNAHTMLKSSDVGEFISALDLVCTIASSKRAEYDLTKLDQDNLNR